MAEVKDIIPNKIKRKVATLEAMKEGGMISAKDEKELKQVLVKKCVKKVQREHQQTKLLDKAKHKVWP